MGQGCSNIDIDINADRAKKKSYRRFTKKYTSIVLNQIVKPKH